MGNITDYYHILGVSYSATFNDIKEAYRKKVKEWHPDKENGDAELFKKVKEAYDVLHHDKKKKIYDELLFETNNQQQEVPANTNFKVVVINRKRKNQKLILLSSLTINAALILIRMLGKKK